MFSSLIKKTIAFSAAVTLSSSFLFSGDLKDSLEKLSYLNSISSPSTSPWSQPSAFLTFYSRSELDSQKKLIENLQKVSKNLNISVEKVYFEEGASQEHLEEKLNMSLEEIEIRLNNRTNFVFINNSEISNPPVILPEEDYERWAKKCLNPIVNVDSLYSFYSQCRRSIENEYGHALVLVNLDRSQMNGIEALSKHHYKLNVLNVSKDVAKQLELDKKGVYLVRMKSIYDGDFDSDSDKGLKFIKYEKEFDIPEIYEFIETMSNPAMFLCDSFEKLRRCLSSFYGSRRKMLYVLTSNINSDSKRYKELVQILYRLKTKFNNQFTICIIPNDALASKLGLIRSKKLRNFLAPEIRFFNFNKLISTKVDSTNTYPIVDCKEKGTNCEELMDSHYSLKFNFDQALTYENLENFIEQSLNDALTPYYETDTTPSSYVRKLCAPNFNEVVINSKKNVVVELYGKFCPGCIGFKKFYSQIAEEMKDNKDIVFTKICVDHNMVPELTDKKPHTPIFWIYKRGNKDKPVMYEGKLRKEDLEKFIKKILITESDKTIGI